MARSNASEAIDQRNSRDWSTLEDVISAYLVNLNDTLLEMGIVDLYSVCHEAFIKTLRSEARRAKVSLKGTSYAPTRR